MQKFESIFTLLNRILVSATLAAVFVTVFANVVGRYAFGSSFAWAEEVARHLMILGAFAGAGLALREGRLVSINILSDLLSKQLALKLRWLIVIMMFAFMGTMMWLGIEFVQFGWNKETMSTGIPKGIPYLAIPIGCGLFLVHLAMFARRFVHLNADNSVPDHAEKQEI
nr:TRAP transporter small permease [uncultured Cohaesibacter sp.]